MARYSARLSESLRLALVYRLARELNAEMRPIDVLRRVLNDTAEALGTPHASIIALRHKEIQAVYALGGGDMDPMPVIKQVLANGLAGFVLHNYRTVIINDITNNPLWMPLPCEPLSPQGGSALCVPLIYSGDVVGVMTLAHPAKGYFTADAVNLTNTISEMGAAALMQTMMLEAARRAEQRYTTLFDDAIVPIIITDLQGNIQTANRRACEFLGYEYEEMYHQTITAIHRTGTGPIGPDQMETLKRGLEVRFQSVVWTKDGSSRDVQVYAKRLGSGENDCIQWIEHDMSSRLELDQLRSDLTAMIFHDIRGPLGNVHTSLAALAALLGNKQDKRILDLLDIALQSEQQVHRMVSSLLDIQYLEEGSKLLSRTNTVIEALVMHAIDQVRPSVQDRRIQLEAITSHDLPVLYIDSDMIERVLINLIDNAVKYSPDGELVTVSAVKNGLEVWIRVKDTGPGIPAAAQATIFDKFARVKQRHMPHGVGLGLAFCKLAVEAHGGRIWVQSEENNGSQFTFALPIEAPATQELPLLSALRSS